MDETQAKKLQKQLAQLPTKQAEFINYSFMQDTQQAIADAICKAIPAIPRTELDYSPDRQESFMPTYLSYILALAVEGQVIWDRRVAENEDDNTARTRVIQLLAEATVKLAWHPFDAKLEGVLMQILSAYATAAQVHAHKWFYLVEITRVFIRQAAKDLAQGKRPGESIKEGMFEQFEELFEREDIPFFGILKKAVSIAVTQMGVVSSEAEKRNISLEVELNDDMDDAQSMSLAIRFVKLFSLWRKPLLINIHPSGNATLGYYSDFATAWKNCDYPIETAWVDSENVLRVPFNIVHDRSIDSVWMMVLAETLSNAKNDGLLEQPDFKINATAFAMI